MRVDDTDASGAVDATAHSRKLLVFNATGSVKTSSYVFSIPLHDTELGAHATRLGHDLACLLYVSHGRVDGLPRSVQERLPNAVVLLELPRQTDGANLLAHVLRAAQKLQERGAIACLVPRNDAVRKLTRHDDVDMTTPGIPILGIWPSLHNRLLTDLRSRQQDLRVRVALPGEDIELGTSADASVPEPSRGGWLGAAYRGIKVAVLHTILRGPPPPWVRLRDALLLPDGRLHDDATAEQADERFQNAVRTLEECIVQKNASADEVASEIARTCELLLGAVRAARPDVARDLRLLALAAQISSAWSGHREATARAAEALVDGCLRRASSADDWVRTVIQPMTFILHSAAFWPLVYVLHDRWLGGGADARAARAAELVVAAHIAAALMARERPDDAHEAAAALPDVDSIASWGWRNPVLGAAARHWEVLLHTSREHLPHAHALELELSAPQRLRTFVGMPEKLLAAAEHEGGAHATGRVGKRLLDHLAALDGAEQPLSADVLRGALALARRVAVHPRDAIGAILSTRSALHDNALALLGEARGWSAADGLDGHWRQTLLMEVIQHFPAPPPRGVPSAPPPRGARAPSIGRQHDPHSMAPAAPPAELVHEVLELAEGMPFGGPTRARLGEWASGATTAIASASATAPCAERALAVGLIFRLRAALESSGSSNVELPGSNALELVGKQLAVLVRGAPAGPATATTAVAELLLILAQLPSALVGSIPPRVGATVARAMAESMRPRPCAEVFAALTARRSWESEAREAAAALEPLARTLRTAHGAGVGATTTADGLQQSISRDLAREIGLANELGARSGADGALLRECAAVLERCTREAVTPPQAPFDLRAFAHGVVRAHCEQRWWPRDLPQLLRAGGQALAQPLLKIARVDPDCCPDQASFLLQMGSSWASGFEDDSHSLLALDEVLLDGASARLDSLRTCDGLAELPSAARVLERIAAARARADELAAACCLPPPAEAVAIKTALDKYASCATTSIDRLLQRYTRGGEAEESGAGSAVEHAGAHAHGAAGAAAGARAGEADGRQQDGWRGRPLACMEEDYTALQLWKQDLHEPLADLAFFTHRPSALFEAKLEQLRAERALQQPPGGHAAAVWTDAALFEAVREATDRLGRLLDIDNALFSDIIDVEHHVGLADVDDELRAIADRAARRAGSADAAVRDSANAAANVRRALGLIKLQRPIRGLVTCLGQFDFGCARGAPDSSTPATGTARAPPGDDAAATAPGSEFARLRNIAEVLADEQGMRARRMADCRALEDELWALVGRGANAQPASDAEVSARSCVWRAAPVRLRGRLWRCGPHGRCAVAPRVLRAAGCHRALVLGAQLPHPAPARPRPSHAPRARSASLRRRASRRRSARCCSCSRARLNARTCGGWSASAAGTATRAWCASATSGR